MSYDSRSNATDRSSSTAEPASLSSDGKQEERKPFVKPELRRETGLVDGTAGTFSNMS
ncbi:MAG: hypothetical protein ABEL04_13055 [Salinibacter sp.]|uniref:hypothetical protein n=1 Tax=Salinibacter sp. TaxID=2065818 RepID=UPI0035D50F19